MSTRYNTGNPIESTDVRDMSDNAKNLDLFSNSSELSFDDRLGVERKTIHGMNSEFDGMIVGMNSEFDAQILNMGFTRVGTFATGATLTNPRQTLLWDVADGGDGQEYGWSGAFPPSGKVVPPGSTPLTTGGIAVGAWISRFDPALRVQTREALRRSYAEAGYNLVDGSFEAGGTLVNANDVLLQERTGKVFSGPAGIVAAGTNPASGGFVDKSGLATIASAISNANGGSVQDFIDTNTFKTVADMKAFTNHIVGSKVVWQGYYAQSDGGSGWGVVKNGVHVGDDFTIFSIDSNTYVEANLSGSWRVNIRKAGAQPVAGFNNQPAIKKVVDYTLDRRVTWIPNGTWELHSTLEVRKGTMLQGSNLRRTDPRSSVSESCVLYWPFSSTGIRADQADLELGYIWSIQMSGFVMKGNNEGGGGNVNSTGIFALNWAWANISNVTIERWGVGVITEFPMGVTFTMVTIAHCEQRCFTMAASTIGTTVTWNRCSFRESPWAGEIQSTATGYNIHTVFSDCSFESCTVGGVNVYKSNSVEFLNCYCENMPNDTITTNGTVFKIHIDGSNPEPNNSIVSFRGGLIGGGNSFLWTDSTLIDVGADSYGVTIDDIELRRATNGIRVADTAKYGVITLGNRTSFTSVTNLLVGKKAKFTGGIPTTLVGSAGIRWTESPRGKVSFVQGGSVVGAEIGEEITWANEINETVGAAIKAVRENGSQSAAKLQFKTSNNASEAVVRWELDQAGNWRPFADNSFNVGSASNRVKEVFAAIGTINTSDARQKTDVTPLNDAELAAAAQLSKEIGGYKWLASVASKGDSARYHIGMTVQRAIEIMESHGLDAMSYGFICHDTWDETPAQVEKVLISEPIYEDGELVKDAEFEMVEVHQARPSGESYGFRNDQLILFIIAGIEHRLSMAGI